MPLWQLVTVASRCSSICASGQPTSLERPTTTTSVPTMSDVIGVEQLDHAERRARVEPGHVAREPAGAQDREAVDVLVRVDQLDQRHRIEMLRERQLQQDPGDLRVWPTAA